MSAPVSPPPDPGDSGGEARRALEVLAFAFLFPAALVVGYVGGRWLGARAGAPAIGGLVGAVLGAVAGFWQLYLFLRRLPRP